MTSDKPNSTQAFKKVFPYVIDEIYTNNEQIVIDTDSDGQNVKIGRKIPIVNEKFDIDERFDFDSINNEDNKHDHNENDKFEVVDDEPDQNEYYENGQRSKI